MILESGTTLIASLQASVAANPLMVSCSFADHSRANAQFLPGAQYALISGTARASMVSQPSDQTQRQVKKVSIYNADTSTATVFVHKLVSDVSYTLIAQGMLPGETFWYGSDSGWHSRNSAGGEEMFTNFVSVTTNNILGTWTSAVSASIVTASWMSSIKTAMAREVWSSGVSAKASIGSFSWTSSSRTAMAVGVWTSGISIGNATAGGTLIPAISSISTKVPALVVQPSTTSFFNLTWTQAQPGDQILVTLFPDAAQSSLSSGLVVHSHCTVAGRVEMRWSNISTLVQNQSSKSYYLTRITPF